jgi:hypothetical protein
MAVWQHARRTAVEGDANQSDNIVILSRPRLASACSQLDNVVCRTQEPCTRRQVYSTVAQRLARPLPARAISLYSHK